VDLLDGVSPARRPLPVATNRSVVEAIATLIRGHLLEGSEDRLPAAAPDLVYLTLLPYLGSAETKSWTEAATSFGG
jgi:hypothetical protein